MNRIGLKAKLLIGMFLILCVSIALVASQAVMLFQEDKASYVFELNATQAIKIADEIQANVRHLTEKIRILFDAARLPLPAGPERTAALVSMLRQYPEFLLLSVRAADGTLNNLVHSPALERFGLTIADLQAVYLKAVPFDQVTADTTFVARVTATSKSPTFTLAVRALPGSDGAPGPVLVAEVPLDRLYAAGGASKLFEIAIADGGGRPLVSFGRSSSSTFAELLPKTARTAGTREYVEGGVAMLGAYAPVGDLGLWTIVQIPKALAFEAARRLITRSLVLAGVVGVLALALVFLFSSSITGPLVALTRATEQIGQGQFDVQIPVSAGGEIGALGARFKRMTEELSARESALKEANMRLIESEKMTALGQLGAGIAHEVKNPMTSIRGYAQMGLRKVPEDSPLFEYFKTIEKETGRSLDILKNLLKFSRQETAEMSLIDVNSVVTDTLKLVTHQLEMKKVTVVPQLCEESLQVMGNANQLEQVLLNLCMNAGDAMEKGGTLTVSTDLAANGAAAKVRVSDTGSGIPPEAIGRIFDPFFTTKPVGKGTGLGLSVSYGIVKDHKGEIKVESRVGHGTTFHILIPIVQGESELPVAAAGGEKRVRVISLR
jgi:two-component system, NtrC family, sensor kinase